MYTIATYWMCRFHWGFERLYLLTISFCYHAYNILLCSLCTFLLLPTLVFIHSILNPKHNAFKTETSLAILVNQVIVTHTRVLQTCSYELDNVGRVQRPKNRHFSAEHLHVTFTVRHVGSVPLDCHYGALITTLEWECEKTSCLQDNIKGLDI